MIKSIKSALSEIHNVSWPTKKHAINISKVTIIFTLFAALSIWVIDYGFTKSYTFLSSLKTQTTSQITPDLNSNNIDVKATWEDWNAVNVEAVDTTSTKK